MTTLPSDTYLQALHPVISDGSGNTIPPRPKLEFPGATVIDDPVNQQGKVLLGSTSADTNDWVPDSGVGQKTHGKKTSLITTTNATTAIETVALPDSAVTAVYAEISAHQKAGTSSPDGAEFQLKGVWRRDGGAPVQIKAPTVIDGNVNASGTGWTAVLLVSGNTVLINVTGDTGKTISWRCTRVTYEGA